MVRRPCRGGRNRAGRHRTMTEPTYQEELLLKRASETGGLRRSRLSSRGEARSAGCSRTAQRAGCRVRPRCDHADRGGLLNKTLTACSSHTSPSPRAAQPGTRRTYRHHMALRSLARRLNSTSIVDPSFRFKRHMGLLRTARGLRPARTGCRPSHGGRPVMATEVQVRASKWAQVARPSGGML